MRSQGGEVSMQGTTARGPPRGWLHSVLRTSAELSVCIGSLTNSYLLGTLLGE